MKFTVNSKTLAQMLTTVGKAQESKSPVEALENILFDVSGGKLVVLASDGANFASAEMDIYEAEGEGKVAINVKDILVILKNLGDMPVVFNIADGVVEMKYGKGRTKSTCLDGADFPTPLAEEVGSSLVIKDSRFLAALNTVHFAVADDELRPQMCGVYIDTTDKGTTFVATDGHKLAKCTLTDIKGDKPLNLPKKLVSLLRGIVGNTDKDITIKYGDRTVEVDYDCYKVCARLNEGKYPNYMSVIPNTFNSKYIVNREELIRVLKRLNAFASQTSRVGAFAFGQSLNVLVEDIDFAKTANEELDCTGDGELTIGFNLDFILECLNAFTDSEVEFDLYDSSRAAVLVPKVQPDNTDVLMLLMPCMIEN